MVVEWEELFGEVLVVERCVEVLGGGEEVW